MASSYSISVSSVASALELEKYPIYAMFIASVLDQLLETDGICADSIAAGRPLNPADSLLE